MAILKPLISTINIIRGSVNTYSDLPNVVLYNGKVYLVKTPTGIWPFNRSAGLYISDGTTWNLMPSLEGTLVAADVINNLTSTAVDKPLSANMGRVLESSKVPYIGAINDLDLGIHDIYSTNATFTGNVTISSLAGSGYVVSTNASNILSSTRYSAVNIASSIVQRDPNGDFTARIITATTFVGAFSGTVTDAVNIGITDDTTTNATMYPLWVTANTGSLPAKVSSTKLSFNPSSGIITSGGLVAPASGFTISGTTNGQLWIGNTTTGNFTLATLTGGTGVTVNNTAGAISLSIGQSVSTLVSPQFIGLNLSGLNASQVVVTNSLKNFTSLAYTPLNTASTIIQRDGSGNFAAGTITAALTGNATTATTATSATTATNLAGGTSGAIPYQSAANTTSFLATANDALLITNSSGVPALGNTLNNDFTLSKVGTGVTETLTLTAGIGGGNVTTNSTQISQSMRGGGGGTITALQKLYFNGALYDYNFSGNYDIISFTPPVNSNGTVQAAYKYLLSGQEFTAAATTSTSGVAQVLFVNRTGNRQLALADSAAITPNSTNAVLRFLLGSATPGIDAISTDGSVSKTLKIQEIGGGTAFGGDVGLSTATAGATRTLSITNSNNSNTASHALIQIQTGGASGGDPKITFTAAGVTDVSQGYDTSTGLYTISNSTNLGGASNMLTISPAGAAVLTGSLTTGGDVSIIKNTANALTTTFAISAGNASSAVNTNAAVATKEVFNNLGLSIKLTSSLQYNTTDTIYENVITRSQQNLQRIRTIPYINSGGDLQSAPKFSLTGQEFNTAATTATDGVAILLNKNRSNNRRIAFGDTVFLTQSTINPTFEIGLNGTGSNITCNAVATDGTTALNLSINSLGGNIALGTSGSTVTSPGTNSFSITGNSGSATLVAITNVATGGGSPICFVNSTTGNNNIRADSGTFFYSPTTQTMTCPIALFGGGPATANYCVIGPNSGTLKFKAQAYDTYSDEELKNLLGITDNKKTHDLLMQVEVFDITWKKYQGDNIERFIDPGAKCHIQAELETDEKGNVKKYNKCQVTGKITEAEPNSYTKKFIRFFSKESTPTIPKVKEIFIPQIHQSPTAQRLQKLFPTLTTPDEDGIARSVNYAGLTVPIISSLQHQNSLILDLTSRIEKLEMQQKTIN